MPGSIPRPTYLNLLEVGQHEPGPVRYSADQLRTCLLLAGWKPKLASRAVNRVFLLVQERLALAPADPASLVGGLREACPGLWEASLPRSDLEALLLGGFTTQAPDSTLLPDLRSAMSLSERRTSVTILLCGTSGTGKSTLASLLAGRLGIPALLSTDAVRHALRAFSTDPLLAASSYACGPLVAGAGAAPGDERGAAVRGFKAQCAGVAPGVERLAAAAAVRRQSMVVEGVHLRPGWAAAMAARLTSPTHHVLPFLVCIANEAKHAERFAVRSKTMTLRPDANRYVRHLRSIRVIQDHLLRDAGAHLIPVVNNTNVDRSLATIHATVLACLRLGSAGVTGAPAPPSGAEAACAALAGEFARCRAAAWSGRAALDGIRAARRGAGAGPGEPGAGSESAGPSTSAALSAASSPGGAPWPGAGRGGEGAVDESWYASDGEESWAGSGSSGGAERDGTGLGWAEGSVEEGEREEEEEEEVCGAGPVGRSR